jgi:peptidoglycan/LPS O-acetylase OafA/YrhL
MRGPTPVFARERRAGADDDAARDAPDQMPALTGIRLPLALWVVAHHISGPGRMLDPLTAASPALYALIDAAWVALSAFFAISGFVLARRYRNTVWSRDALARFAAARFGRIYPVYFLSLLILLPIIWEAMRQDDVGSLTERTGLLLNYVLLLQGWHWPSVNWNTPAWSLSCEVFFYACAPIVVLLVRVTSWPRVMATAGLACALPIGMRLLIDPPMPKALLYFGDFLIGIAAAGLYEHCRSRGARLHRVGPWVYGPAFAGGIALLLSRDALGSFLVFDSGVRIVSALLVFGLACGGGWLVRALSSPIALAGGRASYAIYILHIPVLWYYRRLGYDTAGHPVGAGVVYVLVVIALSLIVARWYEAPANAVLRRWWAARQQRRASSRAPIDGGDRSGAASGSSLRTGRWQTARGGSRDG